VQVAFMGSRIIGPATAGALAAGGRVFLRARA
jgi:hypothetical protein